MFSKAMKIVVNIFATVAYKRAANELAFHGFRKEAMICQRYLADLKK